MAIQLRMHIKHNRFMPETWSVTHIFEKYPIKILLNSPKTQKLDLPRTFLNNAQSKYSWIHSNTHTHTHSQSVYLSPSLTIYLWILPVHISVRILKFYLSDVRHGAGGLAAERRRDWGCSIWASPPHKDRRIDSTCFFHMICWKGKICVGGV